MGEREPRKETVNKGELFYLTHPGNEKIFSGYGLTLQPDRKDNLTGLLMVDRPNPADPEWLRRVEETFGECRLVPMTSTGERGIVCRMQIESESQTHLRQFHTIKSTVIEAALEPVLEEPPKPIFNLLWNEDEHQWQSQIAYPNKLPKEVREVFNKSGHGCLAIEADIGIVHVCHAHDLDIDGFADKPVLSQWQLIRMPTAPLIRLKLTIFDQPENPYRFESFLNVTEEDQANVLAELANQEKLYLSFYGDNLDYHFTKIIPHDKQQWQQIDELSMKALDYYSKIPSEQRDFDKAKEEFMK